MILTQRQLDVLNHVVEDGQAWADNAKQEAHVLAKVAKYEAEYDAKVLAGGYQYAPMVRGLHHRKFSHTSTGESKGFL
jgi:hypothetical protein